MNFPALPRLLEIRIELKTLESKVGELTTIVAALRQRYEVMRRVNHFGDQSRLQLQESPLERSWSGTTKLRGKEHAQYKTLSKLDYRIVTLVWKVTLDDGTIKPESQPEDDFDRLTHIPGPDIPFFIIDRPGQVGAVSVGPTVDEVAAQKFMQDWTERRSLLGFAKTGQKQV